jgi:HlyD family secretion protein
MIRRYFLLVPALLGFCLALSCTAKSPAGASYEFASAKRGELLKTVSATGLLKPIATVSIISQISGKADRVLADFNDEVRKGDLLVELNTDTLQLQRQQLQAQVAKARSAWELQRINYQNQQALAKKKLISQYELKQTKNQLDASAADLAIAESNLKVKETEINHYSLITSPVDGTVLDRNINEGATVVEGASSNSTPIFTIAENLREMQIEAWVGELDIGSIVNGQEVRFTLEAFSGKAFSGAVDSIRLSPQTQDGVVSYKVIVSTENADMSLLPGMTCELEFIEDRREDVILIPNAALRFSPASLTNEQITAMLAAKQAEMRAGRPGTGETAPEQQTGQPGGTQPGAPGTAPGAPGGAPAASSSASGGILGGILGGGAMPGAPGTPGGMGRSGRQAGGSGSSRQTRPRSEWTEKPLWFINTESGQADCVLVRAGLSDGVVTEVDSPLFTDDFIANTLFIVRERVR